jgi:cell division protein YceG involved in septum cleavage
MENLKSTKIDCKKLVVVIFLVLFTALIVGLVTWYFMNDLMQQESEIYEKRINSLQIENSEIQKELKGYEEDTNLVEVGPLSDETPSTEEDQGESESN